MPLKTSENVLFRKRGYKKGPVVWNGSQTTGTLCKTEKGVLVISFSVCSWEYMHLVNACFPVNFCSVGLSEAVVHSGIQH